jgi:RAB protein geranylgeranyltransferase component A
VYIVNDDLKLDSISLEEGRFKSMKISFNETPVVASHLIVGPEYQAWVASKLPESTK